VALGPVVAGSRLAEDEVVWPEDLAVRSGPNGVHGTRLEVDKDSAGNVLAAGGFIIVNIDALKLGEDKARLRKYQPGGGGGGGH
jgi:hypothetical protein